MASQATFLALPKTGVGIGMTRPIEICGRADLALDDDRAVQVQEIERLGIGLDLDIHDLALQRDLAGDVEDRFLGVEQRPVEHDGAVLEVEPAQAHRGSGCDCRR